MTMINSNSREITLILVLMYLANYCRRHFSVVLKVFFLLFPILALKTSSPVSNQLGRAVSGLQIPSVYQIPLLFWDNEG